uniref:Uncharacterized protein n=1 Tax=Timspurckia oligopyrenoides TaxID=708627 RepID=A0A7S1EUG1_9RHOD|mmetsp:Transcript_834/g.1571  ORF Transcript_834/g.1571 Transcript_834/m.1571 type:complete len:333 (+) Transcript_834:198-1196(+)
MGFVASHGIVQLYTSHNVSLRNGIHFCQRRQFPSRSRSFHHVSVVSMTVSDAPLDEIELLAKALRESFPHSELFMPSAEEIKVKDEMAYAFMMMIPDGYQKVSEYIRMSVEDYDLAMLKYRIERVIHAAPNETNGFDLGEYHLRVLPTAAQLIALNEYALEEDIAALGDYETVAAMLKMITYSYFKKNFCERIEILRRIQPMIEESGVYHSNYTVPTDEALDRMDKGRLRLLLKQHYGKRGRLDRLGMGRKSSGVYPRMDPKMTETVLLYVLEHGEFKRGAYDGLLTLPTVEQLREAGKSELADYIEEQGLELSVLARNLNLYHARGPSLDL